MLFTGCAKDIKAENAEVSATEAVTETETLSETTVKATETTVQPTSTTETASETIQPTIKEEAPVVSAEEPQPDTTPAIVIEEPVFDNQVDNEHPGQVFNGEEFVDANEISNNDYDPVLHELGIDIVLTGTPAEQCQQYGEALESVFPGHISYDGNNVGPYTNMEELDRLCNTYSQEELVNMYNEWLAGRNIEDISDQELFDHLELASAAFDPAGVGYYLASKYDRTFADGHVVSW